MTKKLKFNIKKCLSVELYQFKQRGPLIMNHRVDCQFSTGALDYYKSPRLLVQNHTKRLLTVNISDPLMKWWSLNLMLSLKFTS